MCHRFSETSGGAPAGKEAAAGRLTAVFEKARCGLDITVGAIGGSVTEAFASSDPLKASYGGLLTRWIQEQFPSCNVRFVNAGLGATGSVIGVHRATEQLLPYEPDIVLVDFSVNDPETRQAAEAYESLLYRCLTAKTQPAVVCVSMVDFRESEFGSNFSQELHRDIARHYGVPLISVKDEIRPLVYAGEIVPERYWPDKVHPNDEGHQTIFSLLRDYFQAVLTSGGEPVSQWPLPRDPLFSRRFAQADLLTNQRIQAVSLGSFRVDNEAFYRLPYGWRYDGSGRLPLVFRVRARTVGLLYQMVTDGAHGTAGIAVFDHETGKEWPVEEISCDFQGGWGCYPEYRLLARSEDTHTYTVELRPVEGQKFSLLGILIS